MSHGELRTTSSIVGEKTVGPFWSCPAAARAGPFRPIWSCPPAARADRSGAALPPPTEDDQIRLLFNGGLDDPLGRVTADPDDGSDHGAVRRVVEDALDQAPSVPCAGRSLGQRHPLRNLDDAEGRQFAGPLVEHRRAQPDQLLGGRRIGDRDQDSGRQWQARRHRGDSFQRSTRYGLSNSNSRACRSTRSSAWSVETVRFSMMKLPTRPK